MRTIILALFTAVFVVAFHANGEEEAVGAWSPAHRQLRARFVARYHSFSLDGTPGAPYSEFLVYLELWNTNPARGTVRINLDIDPGTNVTYHVTDGNGREVEQGAPAFRSTVDPGVYKLVLPPDSHLRFPVSRNGAGVSKGKTLLDVGKIPPGTWYFDREVRSEFKLSGTLNVPEQLDHYQAAWWRGKLDIPPVNLRVPERNAQPDGPANRSQPIPLETNRTSSAAGSRR